VNRDPCEQSTDPVRCSGSKREHRNAPIETCFSWINRSAKLVAIW
jgi:hypothetical protein